MTMPTIRRSFVSMLILGLALLSLIGCGNGTAAPASQSETSSNVSRQSPEPEEPAGSVSTGQQRSEADADDNDSAASSANEEPVSPRFATFLGIRAPKPASWIEHPPQSPMHETTFAVPGAGGGEAAQIVVFYFGVGQGGPIDANIERWKNQFRSPEGYAAEPEVRELEIDGMAVTLVELEGEYMAMGTRWYTPHQRFISAIVDTPDQKRIFIRFVGDDATVTAHRDAFLEMIENMEWTGE